MEDAATLLRRALSEGPFSMRTVAEETGISYDSLYSWSRGRRTPKPEHLRQVAEEFDRRAELLRKLADELRQGGNRD
jgi:transcriptional regulator with XRE-family HTH domain